MPAVSPERLVALEDMHAWQWLCHWNELNGSNKLQEIMRTKPESTCSSVPEWHLETWELSEEHYERKPAGPAGTGFLALNLSLPFPECHFSAQQKEPSALMDSLNPTLLPWAGPAGVITPDLLA